MPRRDAMMTHPIRMLVLATAAVFAASGTASAAKPTRHAATQAASKSEGHVVDYASLENQVGATLVIETEFKTTRRGTLVKYTNPTLTLKLGPEAGSVDLSVPRESIRKIMLVDPAPGAAAKGSDHAETH